MTGFFDGLVAAFLAILWNAWIVSRVRRSFPGAEGQFLAKIYLWSLGLRYAGALFLNAYAGDSVFADTFWGDSSTYDYGGYLMSLQWSGQTFVVPTVVTAVSGYGFQYFVGAIYFLVGRNQLVVQFLNGTIGGLSIFVIYGIAKHLFDAKAARWAALFMAFFPQMIFWSCAMYKDPSILFCISVCMYAVLKLRERFTLAHIALFVASSLALMTLRFYIFYMVAFATLGTFLFAQRRGLFGSVLAQIALVAVFLGAMTFGVRTETIEQQTSYFDLDKLQTARLGQTTLGKSAFAGEIDVSTPTGALAALPIGLAYLLFAPFPWAITGLRQLMTLPETLVWYALMPSLLRGLRHTLKERLRPALPILVFATTLTIAYAIFQSNVGTAYRQRTQVTMFFFILMGAGIEEKRRQREQLRLRETAVLPAWQR
ncbi:MAG TPA: glycosyltransferase family 39 protein [Vicinamibacteria bacterium]|jgi:4-amino-4-deoxy-L-arabinose transferase-like glycosyltransferase|nr:glycosyltransferase family 39 protein [Vicinamibacteria bacterium]